MKGWCEVIVYCMALKDAVDNQILGEAGVCASENGVSI